MPDGVLRGDEALAQDVGQLVVRSPLGLRHPVHRAERRPELALAHRELPHAVPRPQLDDERRDLLGRVRHLLGRVRLAGELQAKEEVPVPVQVRERCDFTQMEEDGVMVGEGPAGVVGCCCCCCVSGGRGCRCHWRCRGRSDF